MGGVLGLTLIQRVACARLFGGTFKVTPSLKCTVRCAVACALKAR